MDGQFHAIKNDLAERNVELNITSANEHVPDIERFIQVVKEQSRAQYMALPYTKLPYLLVKAIVLHAGKWLNMFCPKGGISGNLSPYTIVTGKKLDYNKDCVLEIGAYVQVHDEKAPRNDTVTPRTTGAIVLGRSGNMQGGYEFMSLATGKKLTRSSWTGPIPVTTEIINRVHELADGEDNGFVFWDRNQDR